MRFGLAYETGSCWAQVMQCARGDARHRARESASQGENLVISAHERDTRWSAAVAKANTAAPTPTPSVWRSSSRLPDFKSVIESRRDGHLAVIIDSYLPPG